MVANEFDCESALTVEEEAVDSNEAAGSDSSEWAGEGEKTEPNTRLRPALRGTVESILFKGHRAYCGSWGSSVALLLWSVLTYEVNVLGLSGLHPHQIVYLAYLRCK